MIPRNQLNFFKYTKIVPIYSWKLKKKYQISLWIYTDDDAVKSLDQIFKILSMISNKKGTFVSSTWEYYLMFNKLMD